MKYIYLLLLLFISLSCKTFDYKSSPNDKYKGKPNKIQITIYDAFEKTDTIIKGKMKYSNILFFDKKNRIYKSYTINSKGDTLGKNCERVFNKKERTIKRVCYNDSATNVRAIYNFNKNFNKSLFEFYRNNKLSSKRVFEYEKNGIDYIDYGYDKNNKLKDKTLVLHDRKRREAKAISFNLKDGSINIIIEEKYDKNGNKYEQNWFKEGDQLFTSYTNRKFDNRNNFTYGEKLSIKKSDTTKSITTIEYKYDKKDNITYKLMKTNNNPSFVEERIITY